jgi:hypothetical protein
LPHVALDPATTDGGIDGEEEDNARRDLRATLAFLLGTEGSMDNQSDDEEEDEDQSDDDEDEDEEECRKLRITLAFMCGVGREAMPRDVFWLVLDLLMPFWDPLRRKAPGLAGGGQAGTD